MSAKSISPSDVAAKLPGDVTRLIFRFIPFPPRKTPPSYSLQRALEKFQKSPKRTAMDMYGLDDFVLC
jgi:hypothetical protein